ncbi:hypothetical protein A4G20_02055 [Pasteurellaceae bacterium RH1A]|nr:hypothetical protein A4G20_02055 [Pasteurellaceae bacterium RH1A]
MNKFTKISAAALVALFLTACDKPADKAATTTAPAAQETKTEVAAPKAETPAANPADAAQAEFQQVLGLDAEFTPALNAVQQKIVEAQQAGNKEALEAGVKEYFSTMEQVIAKYEAVDVKDAQVKSFKDSVVEVLKTTLDFTKEAQQADTPEKQQAVAEKQQTLLTKAAELQKVQNELQARFAPKQEAPAAK